ncbi:MAG: hypothetical protein PHX70_07860 [Clostridium sp.]|nr:hypothetical protein [Clostridium sp.]
MLMNMQEILLGFKNARYNDISTLSTLLANKKKVLLIGCSGAGKTYTINNLIDGNLNKGKVIFVDPDIKENVNVYALNKMSDKNIFNFDKGIIVTVQGSSIDDGIKEATGILGLCREGFLALLDYIVIINEGYAVFDVKKIF